ncbi:FAD-binding oxidoreductase [Fervidibacillus albus]|uniref:D-lactate dehydrogenase (cytochrome) n=1 Tax=Fervidibacillus albus TaxID=2980026 RepID=A0A9E8LWI6_9BACI|nr:FAD-linked oxidase C-terminal domain-containing protein [Fervidibacillus albus]WAA11003.1 FAD-binding protein [Fervidibacillus albus]
MKKPDFERFFNEMSQLLDGEQISRNETVLQNHSHDESYHTPKRPEAVLFPKTTEEVQQIVRSAIRFSIPLIPFGMGTSLEGHVVPQEPSVTIDFSLMNRILEVRERDFFVKVQPGVTRLQLNKELKKYGLFFPVDPGADATLGGMAATNASGTLSVRYGVMRDQVQDLEIVLPDASVIHTGNLAAKSSSGYHLTGLFVGSEGTLGLITELCLKVYGIPEQIIAGRAVFPDVEHAVDAVTDVIRAGIPIARIELLDALSIRQVNRYMNTEFPESATLFFEFHGNEAGLKQDVQFTNEIFIDHHCTKFEFEKDNAGKNKLWEARHNIVFAYGKGFPGKKLMITDVCVPISSLTKAVKHARDLVEQFQLSAGIVGHVGDGNFHVLIMLDRDDPVQLKKAEEVNEQIVNFALTCGGTSTGEHGVGIGKRKYQRQEHGHALTIMERIKELLDPNHLFNPNKVFETDR